MSGDCEEYVPVVAGLSQAGGPLATAGGVHKVVHDNPHDRRRALKLSARDISEGKVSETPEKRKIKQNVLKKECRVSKKMHFSFQTQMEQKKSNFQKIKKETVSVSSSI